MDNVLIVVSDPQLLGDLSDCCREVGLTPHGLTNGSYVLPWIGERDPAMVIIDTQVDAVDNTLFREISICSNAPVILITQRDEEIGQLKAERLGVRAFFSKPIKPAAVFSQIKSLLA